MQATPSDCILLCVTIATVIHVERSVSECSAKCLAASLRLHEDCVKVVESRVKYEHALCITQINSSVS